MTDFQGQGAVAQQANLDFFFGVASKMLEGGEKLIKLNLDTAKTTIADWYQRMQDGLTRKDGKDVPGLQNALALPSAEKVLTYERDIAQSSVSAATETASEVAESADQTVEKTAKQAKQ
jgi:phasin family protein